MLCTLPSLLHSIPSTSGRQTHAPSAQAQFCNSHVPRTAAFSKQICNRNRKLNRGQLQTLCAVKKKSEKNLVCSKTLTVKPDHKDAVIDMCQKVKHNTCDLHCFSSCWTGKCPASPANMINRLASLQFTAKCMLNMLSMFVQVVTFSKEKMKNSKSGILAFECSQDDYEPNVLHFWERYDGNRSMGLHNTTDEYSKFMRLVRNVSPA